MRENPSETGHGANPKWLMKHQDSISQCHHLFLYNPADKHEQQLLEPGQEVATKDNQSTQGNQLRLPKERELPPELFGSWAAPTDRLESCWAWTGDRSRGLKTH